MILDQAYFRGHATYNYIILRKPTTTRIYITYNRQNREDIQDYFWKFIWPHKYIFPTSLLYIKNKSGRSETFDFDTIIS